MNEGAADTELDCSTGFLACLFAHNSGAGNGIRGESPSGVGVIGTSFTGRGIHGGSSGSDGVFGITGSASGSGVFGEHQGTGNGVRGKSSGTTCCAAGVWGESGWDGVVGKSTSVQASGVYGENFSGGHGVAARSSGGLATVNAESQNSTAPYGAAVYGTIASSAAYAAGIHGHNGATACCGFGVFGSHAGQGIGVYGEAQQGFAVSGFSPNNWSGYFQGSVRVVGNLQKNAGSFTIDHPLEPATKYLSHSFVESPDMKNVYDGVVRTDGKGFAVVKLPRYFAALNRDFRYQLTVMGERDWNARAGIYREIRGNRFMIRTDRPQVKVSWQVTGIRKDRWANAHRIEVEERKTGSEAGKYLNPELYGKKASQSVVVLPGMTKASSREPGRRR